jgi:hypothetical protein
MGLNPTLRTLVTPFGATLDVFRFVSPFRSAPRQMHGSPIGGRRCPSRSIVACKSSITERLTGLYLWLELKLKTLLSWKRRSDDDHQPKMVARQLFPNLKTGRRYSGEYLVNILHGMQAEGYAPDTFSDKND